MTSDDRIESAQPAKAPRSDAWLQGAAAVALIGAAVGTVLQRGGQAEALAEEHAHRPVELSNQGYVSSRACRSCHPEQYQSWQRSYHRTMTQPATPQSVFGDFEGTQLEHQDQHARLSRQGAHFYAELDNLVGFGPGGPTRGEMRKREIVLVTGSHHMQVYWYETGFGRALGQLPFIFLKDEQRFIPRNQAFIRPPQKPRPEETGRWNASCINCHTTHGQPRLSAKAGSDTRVAEFGIACEACHGPARQHMVENAAPWSRYGNHIASDADESIVNPARLSHRRSSEVCAQCHAIWQFKSMQDEREADIDGFPMSPGRDPKKLRLIQPSRRADDPALDALLRRYPSYLEGQFWSDGQARVSGREYNGMIDSPCYEAGELTCLSCHDLHQRPEDTRSPDRWAEDQLAPHALGDGACTQCHEEMAHDPGAHTRHATDSEGSRCYNCHMPYTSYGLLKAIRAHTISSPNAQVSATSGRPNACNLCHLDKSLSWTAEQLSRGWGLPAVSLEDEDRTISAAVVAATRGDAGQRALIASALGWKSARDASGRAWIAPYLGLLMDDPYDAVRLIAHRSLRALDDFDALDYDSVPAPSTRPAAAPRVVEAARERGLEGPYPESTGLTPDGKLSAEVERLLSLRNHRPLNLLE